MDYILGFSIVNSIQQFKYCDNSVLKLKKFKQSSGNNSTKSSALQSKDAKKQKMPEVSETARNSTPDVPVQTDEVRQCVVIEHNQCF